MPEDTRKYKLDWNAFKHLSGDWRLNFECLCRTLALRRFGSAAKLMERRNQKGVEFLLCVMKDEPELGKAGTIVGWQCKGFEDYCASGCLTASAKRQIADSLDKTEHVVNVWYLCLQHKPFAKDFEFIKTLEGNHSGVTIRVWHEGDYVAMMDADDEGQSLRRAYFGEMIVTESALESALQTSIAPVRGRWPEGLYTPAHADLVVRKALLEPAAWKHDLVFLQDFKCFVQDLEAALSGAPLNEWVQFGELIRNANAAILEPCSTGETDWVRAAYEQAAENLQIVLRRLRRNGSTLTYALYNVIAGLNRLREIRAAIVLQSEINLMAVMSDAGFGKTCLSMAIAKSVSGDGVLDAGRPSGILLFARDLPAGGNVDGLIAPLSVVGCRLERMEDVLFVLNQTAQRHRCRLPLVIDGLNEAQRPSDWKGILARLESMVSRRFPNVLLVVTLRTGETMTGRWRLPAAYKKSAERMRYHDLCLPDSTICQEISSMDVLPLAQHYFEVYKLKIRGALPPVLRHPLALHLYCEYENRERREWKTPDDLPSDLSAVFADYLDRVSANVAERLPAEDLMTAQDVRSRLRGLGEYLWEDCCRTGECLELEARLGGSEGPWSKSWSRRLIEEGLIQLREDLKRAGVRRFDVAYDALGGYLIAEYLYDRYQDSLAALVQGEEFDERIGKGRHPLAEDILMALMSIYAVRQRAYLGDIAPTWLQDRLPAYALRLSSRGATDTAQDAVSFAFCVDTAFRKKVFARVLESAYWTDAIWGGKFLERLLSDMSLINRDLSWGCWILENSLTVLSWLNDVEGCESVNAMCILKWLLTSTVREIRDLATRRLVEMGRAKSAQMFDFIKANLLTNDPYVGERLLAVGYGVAMSIKAKLHIDAETVPDYLVTYVWFLAEALKAGRLGVVRHHYLALDYLLNTVRLVGTLMLRDQAGELMAQDASCAVSPTPENELGPDETEFPETVKYALGSDLKAYALTRLVGAEHYHMDGQRYKDLESRMRRRIAAMGYRWEAFQKIDINVPEYRWSIPEIYQGVHVERFGHKYSMIAYLNELAERTSGGLPEAMREYADVDPSFPPAVPPFPCALKSVIESEPREVGPWLKQNQVPNLSFLTEARFENDEDGWTLLYGYYDEKGEDLREIFVAVRTFLVDKIGLKYFKQHPQGVPRDGMAEKYYVFYGELPWSRNAFCTEVRDGEVDDYRDEVVNVRLKPEDERTSMRFEIPLAEYTWGSFYSPEHDGCGAVLPSPRLMQDMRLVPSWCGWEMVERGGRCATRYFHGKHEGRVYSLLYIRKDVLANYARARGMGLVRYFVGERNVKSDESDVATISGYTEFAEVRELDLTGS